MRKALSILAAAALSAPLLSCGEGATCRPGTLLMPSAVTLTRGTGDLTSIPGRLVAGPDFGGLAVMGSDESFLNSLPGKGLVFVEKAEGDFTDCDVPPTPGGTSSPPPACFDRRFLPARHDYLIWLPLKNADPAFNGSGQDLSAAFYAVCNTGILVSQATTTIQIRDVRGVFTASAPAAVSLADVLGAAADVPVTVAPDADWNEPVLSCWNKIFLPPGVTAVESPLCDKNNGDPLSAVDEIADVSKREGGVPKPDYEATLRLEVTDETLLVPGNYTVWISNRALAESGSVSAYPDSSPQVTRTTATYNLSLTLQVP